MTIVVAGLASFCLALGIGAGEFMKDCWYKVDCRVVSGDSRVRGFVEVG